MQMNMENIIPPGSYFQYSPTGIHGPLQRSSSLTDRESHSLTIKVPVCWDSLVKLVSWFYSGELPRPISGCLWDNLSKEDKLHELESYVELCSLAQFWLLHDKCFSLIVSILDSHRYLSIACDSFD